MLTVRYSEEFTVNPFDESGKLIEELEFQIEGGYSGILFFAQEYKTWSIGERAFLPAGPIDLRLVVKGGHLVFAPDTMPMTISIKLNQVSAADVEKLETAIVVDGIPLPAPLIPDYYGELEDGIYPGPISCSWGADEKEITLFPQQPDLFDNRLRFLISLGEPAKT